jgi:hypothetical protein
MARKPFFFFFTPPPGKALCLKAHNPQYSPFPNGFVFHNLCDFDASKFPHKAIPAIRLKYFQPQRKEQQSN